MRMNTPRAFWLAFFLTLAVVVPLLGSFALWAVWQQADQALRAAQSTSGLRIQVPTGENTFTMLAVVAGEEPAFVLVRPDAAGGELAVWTVPADSVVRTVSGSYTTLRDCYTDAGPGRAAQALAGTLGIEVRYYLAATRQGWGTIGDGLGQVRVNLDGLAPAKLDELLEKLGCPCRELRSLGGGASSGLWQQIKADVCGRQLTVPACREATAQGAALLAAMAVSSACCGVLTVMMWVSVPSVSSTA